MAKFKKNKSGDLPAISTASLPDIVFMLLFFFMVATVMRDSTLMVQNTLPAADQVQKLDKKDRVIYIYAGKPSSRYIDTYECREGDWRISSRQYIFDWSRTGDDANTDPNGLFAALTYRGKHTMDDISYDVLD